MDEVRTWTVTLDVDEHDGNTRAVARLRDSGAERVVGIGLARLSPEDRDVPEVGAEIAAARALTDLGHRLLRVATDDVERLTGEPAHLVM